MILDKIDLLRDRIRSWLGRPPEAADPAAGEPALWLPGTDRPRADRLRDVGRGRRAGVSSLQAGMSTGFNWLAANNLVGGYYTPTYNNNNIAKRQPFGTSAGNATGGSGGSSASGADQIFSFQQAITAGNSATIDLYGMTNILQQAGITLARIKAWQLRLLSGFDDPTIAPAPNLASTVTLTNMGVPLPAPLNLGNGGAGLTVALTAAAGAVTAVAIGAAGAGYPPSTAFLAAPQQAGGSGAAFIVITNGSGVPTSVVFVAGVGGSGYTSGTVPAIPVGQFNLATGGAHMQFDPTAGGFCPISATSRNVKVFNMDGVNGITIEVDAIAAST